jgi:hypothetical protein
MPQRAPVRNETSEKIGKSPSLIKFDCMIRITVVGLRSSTPKSVYLLVL